MILIDTSAFVEFLNRTGSRADQIVERLIINDDDIALPDIALTEILQGIKDDREHAQVRQSLLTFDILSLKGAESYLAAAELYRKCRKKGLTVRNTIDLLVAQLALEHKAHLVHQDRDFQAIANVCPLKIYGQ